MAVAQWTFGQQRSMVEQTHRVIEGRFLCGDLRKEGGGVTPLRSRVLARQQHSALFSHFRVHGAEGAGAGEVVDGAGLRRVASKPSL